MSISQKELYVFSKINHNVKFGRNKPKQMAPSFMAIVNKCVPNLVEAKDRKRKYCGIAHERIFGTIRRERGYGKVGFEQIA